MCERVHLFRSFVGQREGFAGSAASACGLRIRPQSLGRSYLGQSQKQRVPGLRQAPLAAPGVDPGPRAQGRKEPPPASVWPSSSVFYTFKWLRKI